MVRRVLTEAKAVRAGGIVPEISLAIFTAAITAVNFARFVAGWGLVSIAGTRGGTRTSQRGLP